MATGEFDQLFSNFKKDNPSASFQDLETSIGHIWDIARGFGLDPFATHFEIVPAHMMYDIAGRGLPRRFSHWTHGRAYRQMKTTYDYGLQKIYELVINSNPSQAYLLENNEVIANKVVVAHVLGHTDFFKNNALFAPTRKDMPRAASGAADRIRNYERQTGPLVVEKFLDAALSIGEHVDPDPRHFYRPTKNEQIAAWQAELKERATRAKQPKTEYDDLFELQGNSPENSSKLSEVPIPLHPDRDILGFIRDYSPVLADWQRDVLDIVREESFYFRPQARTKIMNEGWASFWHVRIMREMGERGHLTAAEDESWWRMHTGVVAPNPTQLNPYRFGLGMFEWIADYHNGNLTDDERRWLERERLPVYPNFDGPFTASPGLKAARESMELDDDVSFVRNHFNKVPADRMEMYVHQVIKEGGRDYTTVKSRGWEEIRDQIVRSRTNAGYPYITVTDGNYGNRQELYLTHLFEGTELNEAYVQKVLPYVNQMWGRPVFFETVMKNKKVVFSFDGKEIFKK